MNMGLQELCIEHSSVPSVRLLPLPGVSSVETLHIEITFGGFRLFLPMLDHFLSTKFFS
jgi:hypothetical protein